MVIVIDGYNVLKQVMPKSIVSEHERQQFIHQLDRYAHSKAHKIVIVFDAGPFGSAFKEQVGDVLVIYSGVQESADDVISGYLARHRAQDLLLVSSDRALRTYAKRMSVESIEAPAFYALVQQALATKQKPQAKEHEIIKTTTSSSQEVDALMREAGRGVPHKSEDIVAGKQRQAARHKPSKEERRIAKKISKL